MSHLILVIVCVDRHLPLLPEKLLDSILQRDPEVLQGAVSLLLLLGLSVFLMTLGVMMNVIVVEPVLLLVVLVVVAPQSK